MARTSADLLAMKTELTSDPEGLGLTTLESDDAANAERINRVRASIQIERASIPVEEVQKVIDLVEFRALPIADRQWLAMILSSGTVDPRSDGEIRQGLLTLFVNPEGTRGNLQSLLTRKGSRWEQLVAAGTLSQSGDWTPSDIAAARKAV